MAAVTRDEAGGKYLWQPGWWEQHQRIAGALAAQRHRPALTVSGDLHALGMVRIERSGDLDLARNPVHSVLSGPVGTGDVGWPSYARGVTAGLPEALRVTELQALDERNGFTVLDFDRERCRIEVFGCPKEYVGPDELQPASAATLELARLA